MTMSNPTDPTPNNSKMHARNLDRNLVAIVRRGDLRRSLEAVRDLLAERLLMADTKESASVAKQLVSVLVELDALPDEKRESESGDYAREYSNRIAVSTS